MNMMTKADCTLQILITVEALEDNDKEFARIALQQKDMQALPQALTKLKRLCQTSIQESLDQANTRRSYLNDRMAFWTEAHNSAPETLDADAVFDNECEDVFSNH